jgi:hypothetical protein
VNHITAQCLNVFLIGQLLRCFILGHYLVKLMAFPPVMVALSVPCFKANFSVNLSSKLAKHWGHTLFLFAKRRLN